LRATIEIKMPENCMECPFCVGSQLVSGYYCGALTIAQMSGGIEICKDKRRDDCPLKPIVEVVLP